MYEQVYPVSIVHVLLHPSPGYILPSSQASLAATTLSPQVEVQTEGSSPVQVKSSSRVHAEEHPFIGSKFRVSQASSDAFLPSPQVDLHVEGYPVQVKPNSISHMLLHPSPETVLPSSHYSEEEIIPSPHTGGGGGGGGGSIQLPLQSVSTHNNRLHTLAQSVNFLSFLSFFI